MKLTDGTITFFDNGDKNVIINITDNISGVTFCSVAFNLNQLSSDSEKTAHNPCTIEIADLDKIGNQQEDKEFTFEIPEELYMGTSISDKCELHRIGQKLLDEKGGDWILDSYFLPQSTFSKNKTTGKFYAREIARRYVPIIENE